MNRLVGKLSSVGISSSSSIQVCDNRELQIGKALSTSSSRLSHEETVLLELTETLPTSRSRQARTSPGDILSTRGEIVI